jgi:hypothetical protein
VTDQESTIIASLARIGISIRPHAQDGCGWGWSIENEKIIRNWDGPYPSPAEAIAAALNWLVEYARKGLLCHHVHVKPIGDDPMAPWLRAFEAGISLVE